jgi:hypothetical protein
VPVIDVAEFVTLEHIPLLETGIAYPASTGPFTPSSEMLLEAIAAQDDPHVPAPRLKIGHADNPLDADLQQLWDETNDKFSLDNAATPALGTIRNMTVENGGQTLYGDLHGLPQWLSVILETAYPARSIEGGEWTDTANEKSYKFCLTALALLGVAWPGCTCLADLQTLFSKEGPKVTVIEMPKPRKVAASAEGGTTKLPVVAQVNVEDIRRAFYDDFAQGDRYWWWDRELLIDPLEFIVQDPDEGQLFRLPITTSGNDGPQSVSFGEPEAVKIEYVPDTAADNKKDGETKAQALVGPRLENAGVVLAVNTTPPRERERQNRRTPQMAVNVPALRERLGLTAEQLPDDATEEQINGALAMPSPDPAPPTTPAATPEPGTPESGAPAPGEPTEGGADRGTTGGAPSLVAGDDAVRVDRAAWEETQRMAREGAELAASQRRDERQRFVAAAINDGRIPPSRRQHYEALMERDDAGTREFLSSLQPGAVVPTGEIGHGDDAGADQHGYIDTHLSSVERARIDAARAGAADPSTTRIFQEA